MPPAVVIAVEIVFGLLIVAGALYFISVMVYLPLTGQGAFIPTFRSCVEHILREAPVESGAKFADLGAGDGRVLVSAERLYRVEAVGYECNPVAYVVSWAHLRLAGSRARLVFRDFYKADFSDYDVIYCYLCPSAMKKLYPRFQASSRPGSLIISRIYTIEGWEPFRTLQYEGPKGPETTYFYRVPGALEA